MSTVTTTTVTPAAGQTYAAQPAYGAPAVAQVPLPAVTSKYVTPASLPQYGSLPTSVPAAPIAVAAPYRQGGYRTNLGDYFRQRGEYQYYLAALNEDTPILHEARMWLKLPKGYDLRKSDLEFHQVLKKRQLKKFKKEIIRLVELLKYQAGLMQAPVINQVPVPAVAPYVSAHTAPAVSVPAASVPAAVLV